MFRTKEIKEKKTNGRCIVLAIMCLLTLCGKASAEERYLLEIGVLGGGSYYVGDANTKSPLLFRQVQPTFGAQLRYKLDDRWALAATAQHSALEFDYADASNRSVHGRNTITMCDVVAEFNFFRLSRGWVNRYSKSFSPYIFAGLGVSVQQYGQPMAGYLPFGFGIKWRMSDRWNLNAAWQHQLQFNDGLEGVDELNNPYGLNGSNFMKNDLFSTFTLGLTFNFARTPKRCLRCSY